MTYYSPPKPITSFYIPFDVLYEYNGLPNLYHFKYKDNSYAVISSKYHFKIIRYINNPNWFYQLLGIEYITIYQFDKVRYKSSKMTLTLEDAQIIDTCINYVTNVFDVERNDVLKLDCVELLLFLGEDLKKWVKYFNDFVEFDKNYTKEVNLFYLTEQEKLWLYELMLIKGIVKMPYAEIVKK